MPRYLLGQAPGGGANIDTTKLLIGIATEGAASNPQVTEAFTNGLKSAGLTNVSGKDAAGLIRFTGNATATMFSNEPDPIVKAQGIMKNSGAVFGVAFSFAGPLASAAAAQAIPFLLTEITGRVACLQKGYDFCTYTGNAGKPASEAAWDFMRQEYIRRYEYRLVRPLENGWLSEEVFKRLMGPVTEEELKKYGLDKTVSPSDIPLSKSVIRERAAHPDFDPDKIGALTNLTEAKLRREATTFATLENIKVEKSLKALDMEIYRSIPEFQDLLTSQKIQIYEAIRDRRKELIRKKTLMVFGIGTGITILLSAASFIVAKKTKRA